MEQASFGQGPGVQGPDSLPNVMIILVLSSDSNQLPHPDDLAQTQPAKYPKECSKIDINREAFAGEE